MDDYKPLKELSEGFSTQAKLSNRYWLLLMLASIVSIANLNNSNTKEKIDLPLSLGKVDFIDFNSFILLMICTTSIAFASAFLQAHRTRKLVHRVIDNTPEDKKFIGKVHIQDIFDSIVTPNFNRVAPIAQFLQGENQFFGDKQPNKFYRIIGISIYILLKLISLIIVFIIPLIALFKNFNLFRNLHNDTSWGLPYFFYWFICLLTFGIYFILITSDFKYMFKVTKRIAKN